MKHTGNGSKVENVDLVHTLFDEMRDSGKIFRKELKRVKKVSEKRERESEILLEKLSSADKNDFWKKIKKQGRPSCNGVQIGMARTTLAIIGKSITKN